jgi:hypothetical protein
MDGNGRDDLRIVRKGRELTKMVRRSRGAFELDLSPLADLIRRSGPAAARGAERAMTDIKYDWIREARDIAPLDTRNLRDQMDGEAEKQGLDSYVVVSNSAKTKSGFNYAYYIHEKDAGGKKLRHPGTEKKFLDIPAERNEQRWLEMIESEMRIELEGEGW